MTESTQINGIRCLPDKRDQILARSFVPKETRFMPELKLIAMDNEDLQVISACTQDAVVRVGDMGFAKSDRRFALLMNRYAWEEKSQQAERRRTAMHFDYVMDVTSKGINLSAVDGVLNLLSISFAPGETPAGNIELKFAGGGTIELKVECLEARISDLGASWAARATPGHKLDQAD